MKKSKSVSRLAEIRWLLTTKATYSPTLRRWNVPNRTFTAILRLTEPAKKPDGEAAK